MAAKKKSQRLGLKVFTLRDVNKAYEAARRLYIRCDDTVLCTLDTTRWPKDTADIAFVIAALDELARHIKEKKK